MELCDELDCVSAHVPQRLQLWSLKHKQLQLKLEKIFQGTPDEATRHTAICDLKAGYARLDRGTQTTVSEIRPVEELLMLLKKLNCEVHEAHFKSVSETQQYAVLFKEKYKKLGKGIQDKMLRELNNLKDQHEDEIRIIRAACRQQLANELARISPEHYSIQFTVAKTVQQPTKDAAELQEEINQLTEVLQERKEELETNKEIIRNIKQENDEITDRFHTVQQINTAQTQVALEKQNIQAKKKFEELRNEIKRLTKELDKCKLESETRNKLLETLQTEVEFEQSMNLRLNHTVSLLKQEIREGKTTWNAEVGRHFVSPRKKSLPGGRKQAGRRLYDLVNKVRANAKAEKASSPILSTSTARQVSKHLFTSTSLKSMDNIKIDHKIQKELSGNLHTEDKFGNTAAVFTNPQLETPRKPTLTRISLGENTTSKQSSLSEVRKSSELVNEMSTRKSFQKSFTDTLISDGSGNDGIRKSLEGKALDKLFAEEKTSANQKSKTNHDVSETMNNEQQKETKLGRDLGKPTRNKTKSPKSSTRSARKKKSPGKYDKTLSSKSIENNNNTQNDLFMNPNSTNLEVYNVLSKNINNPFVKEATRIRFQITDMQDVSVKAVTPESTGVEAASHVIHKTDRKSLNNSKGSLTTGLQNAIKKRSATEVNNDTNTDIVSQGDSNKVIDVTKTAKNVDAKLFGVSTEQAKVVAVDGKDATLPQGIFLTETNADEYDIAKSEKESVVSDTALLQSLFMGLNLDADERSSVRAHTSRLDLNMLDESLGNRIYEEIVPTNISLENVDIEDYKTKDGDTPNNSKLTVKAAHSAGPKSISTDVVKTNVSDVSLKNTKNIMKSIPQQGESKQTSHPNVSELDPQLTPTTHTRQTVKNNTKMPTSTKQIDKSKEDIMAAINKKNQETPGDPTANTKVDILRLQLPTLKNKNQGTIKNKGLTSDAKVGGTKLRLPGSGRKKNQETVENKELTSDAKVGGSKLRLPGNRKYQASLESKDLTDDVKKLQFPSSSKKKSHKTIENKGLTDVAKAQTSKLQSTVSGNQKSQDITINKTVTTQNKTVTTHNTTVVSKLRLTDSRNNKDEEIVENKRLPVPADAKDDSSVLRLSGLANRKTEEIIKPNRLIGVAKDVISKIYSSDVGKTKAKRTLENKTVLKDSKADSSKLQLTALVSKKDQDSMENTKLIANTNINHSKLHLTADVDNKNARSEDINKNKRLKVDPKDSRKANNFLAVPQNVTETNVSVGDVDQHSGDLITSQLNPHKKPSLTVRTISNNKPVSTPNSDLQMNHKEASPTDLSRQKTTVQTLMKVGNNMTATTKNVMPFKKASAFPHTSSQRIASPLLKTSVNHSSSRVQREQMFTPSPPPVIDSKLIKQQRRKNVSNARSPGDILVSPGRFLMTSLEPIQPENIETSSQENIPLSNVAQPEKLEMYSEAVIPTVHSSNLTQSETTDGVSQLLDSRAVSLGQAVPHLVEHQSLEDFQYRLTPASGVLARKLQAAYLSTATNNEENNTSRLTPTSGVLASKLKAAYMSTATNNEEHNTPRKEPSKSTISHTSNRAKGLPLNTQSGVTAPPATLTHSTNVKFIRKHIRLEERPESLFFRAKRRVVNVKPKAIPGVPKDIDPAALQHSTFENLKAALLPALGLHFSMWDLKDHEK